MSQPQHLSLLAQQQTESGQSVSSLKGFAGAAQPISFGALIPLLHPALQPEQRSNLNRLYQRLRKQELTKEDFLRATRLLIGDQLLVQTVKQLQAKQQQSQTQRQSSQSEQQQHAQQHAHLFPHTMQPQHHSSQAQESHEHSQMIKLTQQELIQTVPSSQQQLQLNAESKQTIPVQSQSSPLMSTPLHPQNRPVEQYHDLQVQQSNPLSPCTLNLQQHEIGKFVPAPSCGITITNTQLSSTFPQAIHNSVDNTMISGPGSSTIQGNAPQMPIMYADAQVKTPPKKVFVDAKRPLETTPAMQPTSKKQKVSGDILDQSIDQLNDVTAVSGVNLKEEEEQLLTGPKEESRTSQMMRRFVQEEESRMFLDRGALRSKVAAIATKFGLKNVGEDVDRCLSMSTEERLRNMLHKLKRFSAQRYDDEKETRRVIITSDLQKEIWLLRRKAKEAQEKKQAEESERLRKANEKKDKGNIQEGTKEEQRAKQQKSHKEEDEKMRAKAANVAARAAAGVDDMLMKWQMMAEQGRQKREEPVDGTNDGQVVPMPNESSVSKVVDRKYAIADAGMRMKYNAEGSNSLATAGLSTPRAPVRKLPAIQVSKGAHFITVKDILSFLETEPQMAKSDFLYRLYERSHASLQTNDTRGDNYLP